VAFLFRLLISIRLTAKHSPNRGPRSAEQNLQAKFVKMELASLVSPATRWGSPSRHRSLAVILGAGPDWVKVPQYNGGVTMVTTVGGLRYRCFGCDRRPRSKQGHSSAGVPRPTFRKRESWWPFDFVFDHSNRKGAYSQALRPAGSKRSICASCWLLNRPPVVFPYCSSPGQ